MNLFDMIKHDAAQVLRIAADLIFPQDPVETETEEEEFNIDQTVSVGRFTVTLADWPPTLVHELFAFAHEESMELEVAMAVLIGRALHAKVMGELEFHEELIELLDSEADGDE